MSYGDQKKIRVIREIRVRKKIILRKMKSDKWKMILQIVISVLSAVATTLGVTSCM